MVTIITNNVAINIENFGQTLYEIPKERISAYAMVLQKIVVISLDNLNIIRVEFENLTIDGIVMTEFNYSTLLKRLEPADMYSKVEMNDILEDCVKFNSDDNIPFRKNTKLLGLDELDIQHDILGFDNNQMYIGSTNTHFNIKTNNDLNFGSYITVDTPDGKELIAYWKDMENKADLINGIIPSAQLPIISTVMRGTAIDYDPILNTASSFVDTATIVLAGLLNTLNINIACGFYINGILADIKYFSVARTGTNQSYEFSTIQNVSSGDIVSIRITPSFSSGSCSIPASSTANFISII